MLGRSAYGIFWMCRYLERAENTARLLEAGFRMALTRGDRTSTDEWRSVLVTMGLDEPYFEKGGELSPPHIFNYILRDKDNPGSVLSMIEGARTNARMVRTAITREVWEATNESWMILRDLLARPVRETNLGEVLGLIGRQCTYVRGALEGTMLRNEIFNFARIGTFLERADNTARILDVKYHVLLPSSAWVGSSLDHAQWETLLRSVAGDRAYRWLNAGRMDASGIAAFLILDQRFPKSLVFCYEKLRSNMASLARQYDGETRAHALLRDAGSRLHQTTIEDIVEVGLHEFITDFVDCNVEIANAISQDYRFTE
ncbi:alpha-E domain-containing protein [Novosphingobium flavum]|uniref:Alpha-E domain-containing protein n=1 Tax=Novosphingobium flavum TaxID=1778672 RepID=A0A7X1FRM4_9SPHN|nr:alpha-E domain-containing protein [Novosphingobium flavum]MBC2665663.1 alpha-E domain-containing protein [Novosphingobium flavum]